MKASYQPKSQQFLNAGMIFDWEPNRIYQVYTQPGRITDIALEPGEKLSSIAGGDTQRWSISESPKRRRGNAHETYFCEAAAR